MTSAHGIRRWALLAFGAALAGTTARATTDLARGLDCYQAGRYAEARRLLRAAEISRPADPDLEFHLGRLALWFDDAGEALTRLERAVAADPGDARLHNALGDAYGLAATAAPLWRKPGLARRCLAAYERAARLEPRQPAYRWSLLGFHALAPRLAGGDRDEARRQAAALAELDEVEGRIARATLALLAQRPDEAFAEFEPVLKRHQDDPRALYQFGRCADLARTRQREGIAALERCLELPLPPDADASTLALIHHRLGNLWAQVGEPARAAAAHAAATRAQPDFNLAKLQLRR